MIISHNSVVTFIYVLSDAKGKELERADMNNPTAYLHGHFGILPALESVFEGKAAGEQISVDLAASQAYGRRYDKALSRISLKKVTPTHKGKVRKGSHVQFEQDGKYADGTVVKLGKFNADIDTNHPLAGVDLHFEIEVVDIREATVEEVAHGHAHGLGGHHH